MTVLLVVLDRIGMASVAGASPSLLLWNISVIYYWRSGQVGFVDGERREQLKAGFMTRP